MGALRNRVRCSFDRPPLRLFQVFQDGTKERLTRDFRSTSCCASSQTRISTFSMCAQWGVWLPFLLPHQSCGAPFMAELQPKRMANFVSHDPCQKSKEFWPNWDQLPEAVQSALVQVGVDSPDSAPIQDESDPKHIIQQHKQATGHLRPGPAQAPPRPQGQMVGRAPGQVQTERSYKAFSRCLGCWRRAIPAGNVPKPHALGEIFA